MFGIRRVCWFRGYKWNHLIENLSQERFYSLCTCEVDVFEWLDFCWPVGLVLILIICDTSTKL